MEPGFQGKGRGSSFINEYLLPFVRERGAETLSLFKNSEINREFYAKNGFEEFDAKEFRPYFILLIYSAMEEESLDSFIKKARGLSGLSKYTRAPSLSL